MKKKLKFGAVIFLLIAAAVYYYVTIPAINIHSTDTWFFIFVGIVMLFLYYLVRTGIMKARTERNIFKDNLFKGDKGVKVFMTLIIGLGIVYFAGSVLSSPIINARKYQKLMKLWKETDFI